MKSLSSAVLTALASGSTQPLYLVSIQVVSGTLYLWTGIGDLSWNGHTWQGVGAVGTISSIPTSGEGTAQNIALVLNGIDPSMVNYALNEIRQNYPVKVYFGLLSATNQVIIDPVLEFAGVCDVPTFADDGAKCTLSITCENPLVDLQRAANLRYTTDTQQMLVPGDTGFAGVPAACEWNLKWGSR